MTTKAVTQPYLDGIREGREFLQTFGADDAPQHLANLEDLCRQFDAQSPVGQSFRGERDFWRNHLKRAV